MSRNYEHNLSEYVKLCTHSDRGLVSGQAADELNGDDWKEGVGSDPDERVRVVDVLAAHADEDQGCFVKAAGADEAQADDGEDELKGREARTKHLALVHSCAVGWSDFN